MRPLKPEDLVRQYAGYRNEPGVAKRSDVKIFPRAEAFHRLVALAGCAVVPDAPANISLEW